MARTGITSNINAFIKDSENFEKSLREELYAKTIRDAAKWIGARAITQYSISTKGVAGGKGKGIRAPSYSEVGAHPTKFTHRTGDLAAALMSLYRGGRRGSELLIKTSGRSIVGIIRITVEDRSRRHYRYAKVVEKGSRGTRGPKIARPFLAPAVKDAEKVIPGFWDKNLKAVGRRWGFRVS